MTPWLGAFLSFSSPDSELCCGDVGRDACLHLQAGRGCQPATWDSWAPALFSQWQAVVLGPTRVPAWPRGWRCDNCPTLPPMQFCGTIVLIFFLELAVAVLAFLFQDWVRDRFREFFESNIRSYRDDIDLQNLIDSLQKAVSTPLPASPVEQGLLLGLWLGCGGGGEGSAGRRWEGSLLPLGSLALSARGCPAVQACLWCALTRLHQAGKSSCSCGKSNCSPLPQGPDLSGPGHAGGHRSLGTVGTEGWSVSPFSPPPAHDSPSEAIPVPFLPGTFSPSCLRGQSCLEEASPHGEECNLPGICPQGVV